MGAPQAVSLKTIPADVTLQAAAPAWGSRLLAVVLTGMGRDGTDGATLVKAHGGSVIAQDEASSALFGMPRAVAEAGLADRILPLDEIAAAISEWARTLPDVESRSDQPQPYGNRAQQPIPLL